jgi:hypothetical protein
MDIFQLYTLLNDKFKSSSSSEKIIEKLNKMIGVIYGSITGFMCGAPTQPLGVKSAKSSYLDRLPFLLINFDNAINDPIIGQLIINLDEFTIAKWDPTAFKVSDSYKSVVCNSTCSGINLQSQFVDQVRLNKSPHLYNLFSEDFYTRVPLCSLFGESAIDVVISKIMQTHTSFEASAYGLLTTAVIRLCLINECYIDW